MALKMEFYKEIFEKEQIWIASLESDLLNAFYLPELKKFYLGKIDALEREVITTGNEFIKHICFILKNMSKKIDYLIQEDKNGNLINFMELNDLFLTNRMTNNMSYSKGVNLIKIQNQKKDLYALRKQVNNSEELDDDFYYEEKKTI